MNFRKNDANLRKMSNFCVKIDFSFLIMFLIFFFLEEVWIFVLYTLFIVLHELCHYFVATKLGYKCSKIKLNCFGASLEGLDDFLTKDEIKVVLAGPLFNLSVCAMCLILFWINPELYNYLLDVFEVNFAIAVFNLLPIFPLDAGRLALCFLSLKFDRTKSLRIGKIISFAFILILFFIFILSFFYEFNFALGLVCVNLTFLLFDSNKSFSYKRSLFAFCKLDLIKRGLPLQVVYIMGEKDDFKLLKYIDLNHYFEFVFIDENFHKVKTISEFDLYHNLFYI